MAKRREQKGSKYWWNRSDLTADKAKAILEEWNMFGPDQPMSDEDYSDMRKALLDRFGLKV
jgi:hypothetical protein